MLSLHIDTARTWRGGQNQVMNTLMGLRALGHRTLLVAHSEGELRQRAKEGLDLLPLAVLLRLLAHEEAEQRRARVVMRRRRQHRAT